MATNTFKRITKANIGMGSGSQTTIYTVPSGKTSIVIGILVTNKTSNEVDVTLSIDTAIAGQDDVDLLSAVKVYPHTSTEVILGKLVLNHDTTNGDVVKAYASVASAIDITFSFLEDVN